MLIVLGRYLSASSFGVFSIVLGYIYVANALFEPRVQDLAVREFADLGEPTSTTPHHALGFLDLLALEVLGKALPVLAVALLAPVLMRWGNLPVGGEALIAATAVGMYLSRLGNGLATGLLRVLGRSDINALCTGGELALRLLLTLLLAGLEAMSVEACITVQCLTGLLVSAVQLLTAARHIRGTRAAAYSDWTLVGAWRRLKTQKRLILASLGLSISDLISKDLDVTLIAPLVATEQVGVYKMAKSIVMLTWRAIDPFYLALMPEIQRILAGNSRDAMNRLLRRTTTGLLLLSTALSAAIYALVVLIGDVVLGPSFSGIRELMPWMLAGVAGGSALVWGHPLSIALSRPEIALMGSIFGSLVGFAAFLLLVPTLGVQGAGLAWSLAFLTNFMFTATLSLKRWKLLGRGTQ